MPYRMVFILAVLLTSINASGVFAQTPSSPTLAGECTRGAHAGVVRRLAAAGAAARERLVRAEVRRAPAASACLLAAIQARLPGYAEAALRTMLLVLGDDDGQEEVIRRLLAENPRLVAALAATVEPAVGDETPKDLGMTTAGGIGSGPENPGQLNGPLEAPPVSPAAPFGL